MSSTSMTAHTVVLTLTITISVNHAMTTIWTLWQSVKWMRGWMQWNLQPQHTKTKSYKEGYMKIPVYYYTEIAPDTVIVNEGGKAYLVEVLK